MPKPVTEWVHRYDGEPCEEGQDSPLCIHGYVLVEVYTGTDPPTPLCDGSCGEPATHQVHFEPLA